MSDSSSTRVNPLLTAVAWLVVILPTGWGLSYTVKNAMKLFVAAPAAAAIPSAGAPAAAVPVK